MHVTKQKEEFFVIEVSKDEARRATIEVAKKELARSAYPDKCVDTIFEPQVISDGYSGFKVYFRVGTPVSTEKPVGNSFVPSHEGVIIQQIGG